MTAYLAQKKMGFSTDVTILRPPPGKTWTLWGAVEIGNAGALSFTDGTTSQSYLTGSQNLRVVTITNEWYLSCAASTAVTGWLLAIDLGFETYSFEEAT